MLKKIQGNDLQLILKRYSNKSLAIGESEKISGGSELLSDQSRCPFKSFAINRLGAIPAEPTIGISKMTKGTALHIALNFLFTEIPSGKVLLLTLRFKLESLIENAAGDQLTTSCRNIKISQHPENSQNRI